MTSETSQANPIKLSVIVPCYKVEQYLPKCLASLVGQTLQDMEIVCINDGSPDRCIDILHEWQRRYPNKIVIIDKQNEGVWRGRWDGIRVARGEYIGFLDSDDYAEPDFAERLYTAARDADADIAVCGFSRIDLDTGKVLSRELCVAREPFSIATEPGRIVELNGAPWNKVFRAETLKGMHDLTEPPPVLDDLMFQLLAYLEGRGTVCFVPVSLVNYMVRAGSIITSVSEEQVDAVYRAFVEVREWYERDEAPNDLLEALDAAAFLHLGISLNYRLSYNKDVDLHAAVERCTHYLDEHFPTWRHSPYICGRYARINGQSFRRLLTSSRMYRLGLLPQFLGAYRTITEMAQFDIKW
ncbi:MAG: glycosyltransferase [Coriobacteriales bacterium]|nr:glycosyltransferase [Coriobacteriales bacterium]